jgi:glycosyltransferase involved in cell wall biosynthesis
MHITIATGLYPPEIGGPATYAVMLENELPRYGFTIKTVPFGLVRQYPKVIRHLVYTWKLWQASRGSGIMYALDPTSVGLPALLVAKMRRKPFLLRVPGDYAWEQGQLRFGVTDRLHDFIENRYGYGWRVSALCWLESFVAKQAVRVIVPSHYMTVVMKKWGVNPENIQAIYSALHPLPVTNKREELRNQMSLTFPAILSAGRLVPNKGFIEVINSFSIIKKTYPHALLLIAGDGPQLPALIKQTEEKGVTQAVRFLGRLSKEEMAAVIKAADVFVLNTAHEGLSHQILEVMDMGTPIVTTNVGGNPELITDGVQGYLVQYDNVSELTEATLRMLRSPESRERMVQSARASSKKFAKEVVVEEIVAVLKKYYE